MKVYFFMLTSVGPDGKQYSKGHLDDEISCLQIAYRALYYLLPIYLTLVCCKDRGHAAAGTK